MSVKPGQQPPFNRLTQEQMDAIDEREDYIRNIDGTRVFTADEVEDWDFFRECETSGCFEPYLLSSIDEHAVIEKWNGTKLKGTEILQTMLENKIKKIDAADWNTLDESDKMFFHFYCGTSQLPRWGHAYPPTPEFLEQAKKEIDKKPVWNKEQAAQAQGVPTN